MRSYSLKSQAAYLLVSNVVAFAVASLSPILIVRLLSQNQFGVYRQILFVTELLITLLSLRIPESLYYFYPRKKHLLDRLMAQTVNILAITVCIGIGAYVAVGLNGSLFPRAIKSNYILLLAVYLFFETFARLLEHILILEKRSRHVMAFVVCNSLFRVLFVLTAIVIFSSVYAIVVALILLSFIKFSILITHLLRHYSLRFNFLDRGLLSEQFKYIVPLAAGSVVGIVGSQIDRCIIFRFMAPEDFALYTVGGLGIMNAVTMLYLSVGKVCLPKFSEMAENLDFTGVRSLWHKMIVLNSVVTIPVVCFCYVFAWEIISLLFSSRYAASAGLWRINMITLLIQMLSYGRIPAALGKTTAIFAGNMGKLIVSVPCSILLIKHYGLPGGAISFVLGFWVNAMIQLVSIKQELKLSIKALLPWKSLAGVSLVSIASALVFPVVRALDVGDILAMCLSAPIYFCVVGGVFIKTGIIDVSDYTRIFSSNKRAYGSGVSTHA